MSTSIVDGNKMIADFMGAKTDSYNKWFYESRINDVYFLGHSPEEFRYHSSWDWLMSPVQKFLSRKPETEWTQMLRGALTTAEIKTVWDALISAIKSTNE